MSSGRVSSFALFLVCTLVFNASASMIQTDSVWTIPTVASILHDGDTNLDEFRAANPSEYLVREVDGHLYGFFPLATCISAIPAVLVVEAAAHLARVLPRMPAPLARFEKAFHGRGAIDLGTFNFVERFAASLFAAFGVVLILHAARTRLQLPGALLVAGVVAFGTSVWSTASRVLWQHGPSFCAVSALLFLLAQASLSRRAVVLLGVLSGVAYALRPTNSLSVACIGVAVLVTHRRALAYYLLGGALVALPFVGFNWSLYDAALPPYFAADRLQLGSPSMWEGLAGDLISPARGLFVWTPVFLLGLGAMGWSVVRGPRAMSMVDWLALVIPLLHWVAIANFPHWWGGHSIGPRLFTDVTPYFAWWLVRLVEVLSARRSLGLWLVAAVAVSWGAFVHGHGATQLRVHFWNGGPPNVDSTPERLWDWRDPQFLAGLKNANQ